MPRIRTIKPEFWSSPDSRNADPWVRLLYIAMWNWADDAGRGTASPAELAGFAFGIEGDEVAPSIREVPAMLMEIAGRYGVVFYRVGGRPYYAIPSWVKHQRDGRRADPKHPSPEEGVIYMPDGSDQQLHGSSTQSQGSSRTVSGKSPETTGSSALGTGEQGNRGTLPSGESAPARARTREASPAIPDQAPATVPGSITAADVVAAWTDATKANGVSPTTRSRGMVAKEAKSLLDSGNDPDRILRAAVDAGIKGFPNLERELMAMSGRAIPKRVSNKPTRDDKVRALLELAQAEENRNG